MPDKPISIAMRKIFVYFLLSASLLLFAASCFDAKDFELDELSTSDISPVLSLPLFKDSLYLKAGDNIKYVGDTAAFYFTVPTITLPGISTLLTIPPASVTLSPGTFLLPVSIPISPLPPALSYLQDQLKIDITVPFNMPNEEELDRVDVNNMQLTVTNNSTFAAGFELLLPGFTKSGATTAGATYTTGLIPAAGTATISLSGTMVLTDEAMGLDNELDLVVTIIPPTDPLAAGTHTYGASVSLDASSALKAVYGYFGQTSFVETESVSISAFDQLMGDCEIAGAYLNVSATNYLGIPLQLTLDQVSVQTNTGLVTVNDAGTLTVEAASSSVTYKQTNSKIGGEVLSPIINAIISGGATSASFTFRSLSNPQGNTGPGNFFTTSTTSLTASGEVVVPLKLAADDLKVLDTLDISFPDDYTFNSLGAKVYAVNNMPVSVKLQGVLLNASGATLTELFEQPVEIEAPAVDADGKVVAPKESKLPVRKLTNAAIQGLKDAEKVAISLTVNTSGAGTVVITKDNYVKVQVGVQAGVNYDDIKDEL